MLEIFCQHERQRKTLDFMKTVSINLMIFPPLWSDNPSGWNQLLGCFHHILLYPNLENAISIYHNFFAVFFLLFLLSVPFSSLGTASRAHTHTIMETTNWFDLNKWNLNEKTTSFLLVLNAFVRMRSSVRADHGNWLIAGDPYYARLHSQNYQTCQCLKEQLKLQL